MPGNSTGKLGHGVRALCGQANRLTGGALGIMYDAFRHFGQAHAAEAAASITFYAIFSLFPMLLALIVAGSFVLQSEQVQEWVLDTVAGVFPVAQGLIERNIKGVLSLRGTVGTIALISLVWSATGVLTAFSRNINRAWTNAEPRSFAGDRLVALGMIGILAVLLAISSVFSAVLNVLARFRIPLGGGLTVDGTPFWATLLTVVPRLFVFLALMGMYRWVPNTRVKWSEAFWGALVATPAGEITTDALSWYLSTGIVRYELVYGSLGTVVVLMLRIYLGALITLFGAHLSAAVARHRRAT